MSASANDRALLGFFFLLHSASSFISPGTIVVTGTSVTVTSPIDVTRADVDYYWYSKVGETLCDENDLSNNKCTFQVEDASEVGQLTSIAALNGRGFTYVFFHLNETLQPRDCDCLSLYASLSSNVTLRETSKGCPCNGSYLNQFTGPLCDASGNITQAPSPYYYVKGSNVTFTCLIHSVRNERAIKYHWTFFTSSSVRNKLRCHEPVTSTNCTVPGQAEFAKASVQCVAFTPSTAAPCIKSAINSGTAPLGNDLGLYLLLVWFVVSATWF